MLETLPASPHTFELYALSEPIELDELKDGDRIVLGGNASVWTVDLHTRPFPLARRGRVTRWLTPQYGYHIRRVL